MSVTFTVSPHRGHVWRSDQSKNPIQRGRKSVQQTAGHKGFTSPYAKSKTPLQTVTITNMYIFLRSLNHSRFRG